MVCHVWLQRIVKTEGIEVDEVNYQGRSTLHVAAAHGHIAVVSWLVNNMADLSVLDRNGTSALIWKQSITGSLVS